MDRKLIVTLLRKDIQELDMITQGFMEMTTYPQPIVQLAQRKTEDIQKYIVQLSVLEEGIIEVSNTTESNNDNIYKTLELSENKDSASEENTDDVPYSEPIEVLENTIDETPELNDLNEDNDQEVIKIEDLLEEDAKPMEILFEIEPPKQELEETVVKSTEQKATIPLTRNEILSKPGSTIISSIGNKKIADIKQAISIGERFRFQRELFKGNGEDMNKSLTYLNQLATYDEAVAFLLSKYNWNEEDETAQDFLQIVKRRYL